MATQGGEATRLRDRLLVFAAPVVSDHGGELVDVEVDAGKRSAIVRLLVYSESGVTVEFCEGISRELSDLLDIEDPIPGCYSLEVTSPGFDRPLSSDDDFRRAQQRLLKVVLDDGGTRIGRLVEWSSTQIVLKTADGKQSSVDRKVIARATIEIEF